MQDLKSMGSVFPPPCPLLWLHLVVEKHSSQEIQRVEMFFLDTSCICVVLMYCVALTISLKSLNAVYFSTVTNIYLHAAHALFCSG